MMVSINRATPRSSIFMGIFLEINPPELGGTIDGNPHMMDIGDEIAYLRPQIDEMFHDVSLLME